MTIKNNIKKLLLLSLALIAGAGLLVLLIAAINKKNHQHCTGVDIAIHGNGETNFLSRQEVMNIIAPDKSNTPRGKLLASFDLKKMEAALKQQVWIREAQLFFDNNGVLRVSVDERWPVARIFTVNGNSFYIDSTGRRLPLNSRMTIKLPVYSNFPVDTETLYGADSILMQQIRHLSVFILNDPFWMAQIGQIDITPYRSFEMSPVVGRHVIAFGDGTDYEQKFHRLLLFYQQVGAKIGLDTYSVINVQFDNQVVATRKGVAGKIDSLQAVKNIQQLIAASKQLAVDTLSTTVDNNIAANAAPSPTLSILKDYRANAAAKDSLNKVPASAHPTSLKNRAILPSVNTKQPKAVMKKPHG
jgi:cell division protein FtsQ